MQDSLRSSDGFACGVGKNTGENARAEGLVRLDVYRDGKLVDSRTTKNLIVTVGKEHLAGLFCGLSGYNPFKYIAVGTGTTSPSVNDTALQSEITGGGLGRALATCSRNATTAVLTVTWNVTSSYAVTESGVFNASSGGTMYCRTTFAPINVQNGDTLTITWNITML